MGIRVTAMALKGFTGQIVSDDDLEAAHVTAVASVDLNKMFWAVQYFLTGPIDPVVLGAELAPVWAGEMLPIDHGFGPARLASPEKVAEVVDAFSGFDVDEALARFDVGEMEATMIFPLMHDDDPGELAAEVSGLANQLLGLYRAADEVGNTSVLTVYS